MGLHIGLDKYIRLLGRRVTKASPNWKFYWPNTADFNFNFYRLLAEAEDTGIGSNTKPNLRIAIIGAGVAGLTAARELFRSGYTQIDIFEGSDRIGGRTYSIPAPGQSTTFEMGAMRMPFFDQPGSQNSVLDYYRQQFNIAVQPFPDPGSQVANTGIYLNTGLGPAPKPDSKPELLIWDKKEDEPPTKELQAVYKKWSDFAGLLTGVCREKYESPEWPDFWQYIVSHYWTMNFRELAYLEAIGQYDPAKPGYFGGLGMNEKEVNLFYTIGAGDGSWGAFFDISCLYPIRTLLFGYGTNHQLIQGRFSHGEFLAGSCHQETELSDSLSQSLASPNYLGVQTFAECLFFEPVKSNHKQIDGLSLYEAMKRTTTGNNLGYAVNVYLKTSVKCLTWISEQKQVQLTAHPTATDQLHLENYDAVILSPTTWATQMSMRFENFQQVEGDPLRPLQIPFNVTHSGKSAHFISSCKVFYPLKQRYWEVSHIPQIIATDTFLQGVYGYAADIEGSQRQDPGVVLVSYTWEDDANKFLAETDHQAFAKKCLEELDALLVRSQNIGIPISPYVDQTQPAIIQWSKRPNYRGCAYLYRETTWNENYALLRYNQEYSQHSHLYLAGEAFSVEGGWTEPALRGSLDATIHLIHNTGGEFLNSFKFDDYPQYSNWNPPQPHTASNEHCKHC
jgi:tryptophan 2-monooxygenase